MKRIAGKANTGFEALIFLQKLWRSGRAKESSALLPSAGSLICSSAWKENHDEHQ
jgi:hypothetical protein